ncbi:MAG TPA: glycoside hydrolase family 16 protein [Candidatus Akkermansia intestinavium]|nr:glycoside hydrolase family 16 protein [Candidatus Akkermansia intestinavium]
MTSRILLLAAAALCAASLLQAADGSSAAPAATATTKSPAPRQASPARMAPAPALPAPQGVPAELPGGWVYNWGDEFNGDALDESKWNYELGVVRNPGSKQAYTKDCVKLRDGMLVIESRHEPTPNINHRKPSRNWIEAIETQPYASGSITSRGKRSFTLPCRMEFRARIPRGKGVWPAIWTLHENAYGWPANGEIDILEHVSQEPNRNYTTFRWGENGERIEHKVIAVKDFDDFARDFHTYVFEWDAQHMKVFIDGEEIGRINISDAQYPNGDNPLLTPCYLIINTALGGGWAEAADPKDYPTEFLVDYVRCYTRPADCPQAEGAEKCPAKPEAEH